MLASRIRYLVQRRVARAYLALQVHTAPQVLHLFYVQLALGRVQYPQSHHPHAACAMLVHASAPVQQQLLLETLKLPIYTLIFCRVKIK
jgi:hypothetical protein